MSLSPFDSFQSQFVTYLLNFPCTNRENLIIIYMLLQLCLCISAQFSDFKKKMHILFPVIYDTKFLSYEMRKIVRKEGMITCSTLCCALP